MAKLFNIYKIKFKANGIIIKKYHPNPDYDIYIDAIDIETGIIDKKKIIEYSIHENLTMYKIESKLFNTFWVSDDHSLIVFDKKDSKLLKISPVTILKDIDRYCLVRKNKDTYSLIDINDNVKIEYDPSIHRGADFTVEDYYTFATSDGIFVQDTMACYVPLTKEARQEAIDKMMAVKSSAGFNSQVLALKNDVITGIYMATK